MKRTILAIETSCDETAAAVVALTSNNLVEVLGESVASSMKQHVETGGVVPEVAAREQVKQIQPVIHEAILQAQNSVNTDITDDAEWLKHSIDTVAVTQGPGLLGSLVVGVEAAKSLALVLDKQLIAVNHVLAHLYANFISQADEVPQFPILGLIISGGHSEFILMKSHQEYEWSGGTRDDAAGECFDKCARILNLPYHGGPSIAKEAENFQQDETSKYQKRTLELPRPMLYEDTLDMSFSGLKTAVLNETRKEVDIYSRLPEYCNEIQEAITDVIIHKLKKAAEMYQPKTILVAGGVVANKRLRERLLKLSETVKTPLYIPPFTYCTDNAVMIGAYALLREETINPLDLRPNPSLSL